MRSIVISQPMLFPWPGLFEQARLADVFMHFDDAQTPQGRSFVSRAQIKTPQGPVWLSVPIRRERGAAISHTCLDRSQNWQTRLLRTLHVNYARAPFVDEMMDVVNETLRCGHETIGQLNIEAFERICRYFGIWPKFGRTSETRSPGRGSERILNLCQALRADVYVTGHGARHYIDHGLFERCGIEVRYMAYDRAPYRQLWGEFDPHVSILDLIANEGQQGLRFLRSGSVSWREFLHEHEVPIAA